MRGTRPIAQCLAIPLSREWQGKQDVGVIYLCVNSGHDGNVLTLLQMSAIGPDVISWRIWRIAGLELIDASQVGILDDRDSGFSGC
ncbi:hypothetical protein [Yinghuangia soli]|uniref:Uncharacterized protein n=1 Tax=Yinghuangia soli TaxID=2908204 RepID=A0AA41U4U2_9ACTN|nr:hypothetical protein [Yinghuangia soli]MCF2531167.1 hypothetical protein [Yinghuangia soli]